MSQFFFTYDDIAHCHKTLLELKLSQSGVEVSDRLLDELESFLEAQLPPTSNGTEL